MMSKFFGGGKCNYNRARLNSQNAEGGMVYNVRNVHHQMANLISAS